MNYPRVNLIKKSECRYEGLVSPRFILMVGIGTPVILLLLIVGLIAANIHNTQRELESTRELWAAYEPRVESYRKDKSELASTQKIMDLFRGWQASQVAWLGLLDEMQGQVPANIQFTRMAVKADEKSSVYLTPEELQLAYELTIDGVAVGDAAEEDVIALQKKMQGGPMTAGTFSSLKLGSMRKGAAGSGLAMRQFRITGGSEKGEN